MLHRLLSGNTGAVWSTLLPDPRRLHLRIYVIFHLLFGASEKFVSLNNTQHRNAY